MPTPAVRFPGPICSPPPSRQNRKCATASRASEGLYESVTTLAHDPRWRDLSFCCFGFRPDGAEQISSGQRPRNGNSRGKQALKGRNKGLAMMRPYGHGRMRCNGPRAMPGAGLWLPGRGEYTRSPLRIRWRLNDVAEFRDAPMRAPDRRLSRSERLWAGVASTAQHQINCTSTDALVAKRKDHRNNRMLRWQCLQSLA
jgi:hypothetical protein